MFEQEVLKNQENEPVNTAPAAVNQSAPAADLFRQYEIKNWSFTPRVYKILAASALVNLLILFIAAQPQMLTQKGCDSPFVSSVCQVLDTVYVGTRLMAGDNEFAVKEYEKTTIDDAEITYVDVSGANIEPLSYPEGYFALANPEEFAMRQQQEMMAQNMPGISSSYPGFEMPPTGSIPTVPSNGGMNLGMDKPVLPPKNPNAIQGNIPSSPYGNVSKVPTYHFPNSKIPRPVGGRIKPVPNVMPNDSPKKLPEFPGDKVVATNNNPIKKPTPSPTPEVKQPDLNTNPITEAEINKKPLQDFGDTVLDKVTAKTIDLNKSFLVSMQGVITKDGKLDTKKSRFIKQDGDPEMINLAKSAVEAIGDSGLLLYLQRLDVEKVNFTLVQDDKQIYAIITSDQPNDSRAKTISTGLNLAMSLGKNNLSDKIKASSSPADIDTLALLNAAKVEAQGKSFVLKFNLDKPVAQELINRQLQKAQAKRQQSPQPNGNIAAKPIQNAGQ